VILKFLRDSIIKIVHFRLYLDFIEWMTIFIEWMVDDIYYNHNNYNAIAFRKVKLKIEDKS